MDINDQDYHFYDANDDNIENQGLLGSTPDYENEEPKTAQIGFIAAALAALLILVVFILSWILYHKNRGTILLANGIMVTIALLIAALAAVWGLGARKSALTGSANNPLITLVVYVGALLFACYFLLAALFLWVYRTFYANYMYVAKSDPERWDSQFWNYEFDYAMLEDWRILLTIVIFCLVIAVCFAVVAFAAYSFLKNRMQTSKITLMIGLIATTVFAFLCVIWCQDYKVHYNLINQYLKSIRGNLYTWVMVLACLAIVLAFLNAVFNLLRKKASHFVFGCIWLGLAFILLIFFGLLFRDIGNFSRQAPVSCRDGADLIHEEDYTEFCPNKYLASGKTCRKEDFASRWESNPQEQRTLNPACCKVSSDLVVWPLYILAIWGTCLLLAMAVTAGADLALSHFDESYDDEYNKIDIIDLIALGVIVLLILALGLYLIFRPAVIPRNRNYTGRTGYITNIDGTLSPKPGYAVVNDPHDEKKKPVPNGCYRLDAYKIPKVEVDSATCKSSNCGFSVGVTAVNANLNTDQLDGTAKQASKTSRQFFFPNSNNINDDFIHIYGSAEEVNKALGNVIVCSNNVLAGNSVYMNARQADLDKISEHSLTGGAEPIYSEPNQNGSKASFAGFSKSGDICKTSCKIEIIKNSSSALNIVGRLMIIDNQGRKVNYGVPESDVEMNFMVVQNGDNKLVGFGSYNANGEFKVPVPSVSNSKYVGTIQIRDKSGNYMPNDIDVAVTSGGKNNDLNIGDVLMTTVSGAGCKDDTDLTAAKQCFANISPKNHELTVKLQDLQNNKADFSVSSNYRILQTHSQRGKEVASGSIGSDTLTKTLPAGYYTVIIDSPNYNEKVIKTTLTKDETVSAALEPQDDDTFKIYMDIDNTKGKVDYDLNLAIETADGDKCTVSPFNKICPYSKHIRDIKMGEKGQEIIEVSKYLKAYYMVYVSESSAYDGQCAEANVLTQRLLNTTPVRKYNHKLFEFFNKDDEFEVYTTGGGSSNSNFAEEPLQGLFESNANNFIPRDSKPFNPIKFGSSSIISNVMSAIGDKYKDEEKKPDISSLFSSTVRTPKDVDDFVNSLPKIYQKEEITKALDGNLRENDDYEKNYVEEIGSAYKDLKNNDYQTNQVQETNIKAITYRDEFNQKEGDIQQNNDVGTGELTVLEITKDIQAIPDEKIEQTTTTTTTTTTQNNGQNENEVVTTNDFETPAFGTTDTSVNSAPPAEDNQTTTQTTTVVTTQNGEEGNAQKTQQPSTQNGQGTTQTTTVVTTENGEEGTTQSEDKSQQPSTQNGQTTTQTTTVVTTQNGEEGKAQQGATQETSTQQNTGQNGQGTTQTTTVVTTENGEEGTTQSENKSQQPSTQNGQETIGTTPTVETTQNGEEGTTQSENKSQQPSTQNGQTTTQTTTVVTTENGEEGTTQSENKSQQPSTQNGQETIGTTPTIETTQNGEEGKAQQGATQETSTQQNTGQTPVQQSNEQAAKEDNGETVTPTTVLNNQQGAQGETSNQNNQGQSTGQQPTNVENQNGEEAQTQENSETPKEENVVIAETEEETAKSQDNSQGQTATQETKPEQGQTATQETTPEQGQTATQETTQEAKPEQGQTATQETKPEQGQTAAQETTQETKPEQGQTAAQETTQEAKPEQGQTSSENNTVVAPIVNPTNQEQKATENQTPADNTEQEKCFVIKNYLGEYSNLESLNKSLGVEENPLVKKEETAIITTTTTTQTQEQKPTQEPVEKPVEATTQETQTEQTTQEVTQTTQTQQSTQNAETEQKTQEVTETQQSTQNAETEQKTQEVTQTTQTTQTQQSTENADTEQKTQEVTQTTQTQQSTQNAETEQKTQQSTQSTQNAETEQTTQEVTQSTQNADTEQKTQEVTQSTQNADTEQKTQEVTQTTQTQQSTQSTQNAENAETEQTTQEVTQSTQNNQATQNTQQSTESNQGGETTETVTTTTTTTIEDNSGTNQEANNQSTQQPSTTEENNQATQQTTTVVTTEENTQQASGNEEKEEVTQQSSTTEENNQAAQQSTEAKENTQATQQTTTVVTTEQNTQATQQPSTTEQNTQATQQTTTVVTTEENAQVTQQPSTTEQNTQATQQSTVTEENSQNQQPTTITTTTTTTTQKNNQATQQPSTTEENNQATQQPSTTEENNQATQQTTTVVTTEENNQVTQQPSTTEENNQATQQTTTVVTTEENNQVTQQPSTTEQNTQATQQSTVTTQGEVGQNTEGKTTTTTTTTTTEQKPEEGGILSSITNLFTGGEEKKEETTTTTEVKDAEGNVTTTTENTGESVPEVITQNAEEKVVETVEQNIAEENTEVKNERLLASQSNTYLIQFCFTGHGKKSIKRHLKQTTGIPDMVECKNLYPKTDSYSLENLP